MIKLFKKKTCYNCGNKYRVSKLINYRGAYFCDSQCLIGALKDMSTKDVIALHLKEKKFNE